MFYIFADSALLNIKVVLVQHLSGHQDFKNSEQPLWIINYDDLAGRRVWNGSIWSFRFWWTRIWILFKLKLIKKVFDVLFQNHFSEVHFQTPGSSRPILLFSIIFFLNFPKPDFKKDQKSKSTFGLGFHFLEYHEIQAPAEKNVFKLDFSRDWVFMSPGPKHNIVGYPIIELSFMALIKTQWRLFEYSKTAETSTPPEALEKISIWVITSCDFTIASSCVTGDNNLIN